MELKFIGRGSAFNVREGNTSAYYKDELGNMLLIDCGETVFSRIVKLNLLGDVKNLYVAITHLHPDHVGSLGSLIFYCYYIAHINVFIVDIENEYDEDEYPLGEYLRISGIETKMYSLVDTVIIGELNHIDICKTTHKPNMLSSMLLYYERPNKNTGVRTTVYTGDTNDITRICEFVRSDRINKIYCDCCLADYPDNPHLSLNTLANFIPISHRNKIWCMHFDCDAAIKKAKDLGFNVVEFEKTSEEIVMTSICENFCKETIK